MQYKVPQNIDMEDKIVGPFTMKQFLYLLISGGIIYSYWNYLSANYVNFSFEFAIIAIPVGILGFALALVKINDRPFEYFLLNVFLYLVSPKNRRWQEGYREDAVIIIKKDEKVKKEEVRNNGDLDQLAKQLEAHAATIAEKEVKSPSKPLTQADPQKSKLNISVTETEVNNSNEESVKEPTNPTAQAQKQVDTLAPANNQRQKRKGIFSFLKK